MAPGRDDKRLAPHLPLVLRQWLATSLARRTLTMTFLLGTTAGALVAGGVRLVQMFCVLL
jgi:hypothetical protein